MKYIFIILILALLTGCGNDEKVTEASKEIGENLSVEDAPIVIEHLETEAEKAENLKDIPMTYKQISQQDAKKLMDEQAHYTILDVRTYDEFAISHLEGALLLPVDEVLIKAPSVIESKDELIFVYCRSGSRSKTAAKTLTELGFSNVYEIGGIETWPYNTTDQ